LDGVPLNMGIAHAKDLLKMALAPRLAAHSGRLAYFAGRIPKKTLSHRQQFARWNDPEVG
jgi:thiazole synthase